MAARFLFTAFAVSAITLHGLSLYPMKVSVQKDAMGQFAPHLSSLNVAGAPIRLEIITPPSHGTLDTATLTTSQAVYRGSVRIPWLRYTPQAGYTGPDTFAYRAVTSLETSNICGVSMSVYPPEPGGMTVLLIVRDTLLPRIQAEVNQLKADMDSEGYAARIVSFKPPTTAPARALWDTLKAEYDRPGRFMAGAMFIGSIPTTGSKTYFGGTVYAWGQDDRPFWNMNSWSAQDMSLDTTQYGLMHSMTIKPDWDSLDYSFDATNASHIWISRINAYYGQMRSFGQGETHLLKRYFKANHEYRKGITRFSHKAYFHCAYAGARMNYFPDKYKAIWPDVFAEMYDTVSPADYSFKQGGELLDAGYHGNEAWYHAEGGGRTWKGIWARDVYEAPMSLRFYMTGACNGGGVWGITNSTLYTRNGGTLISWGAANYAGAAFNTLIYKNRGDKSLALLGAGERWGRVMIRGGQPRHTCNGVYGDLTLKANMAPHNAMPYVSSLIADRASGAAPLTVGFTAAAGDTDGTVAGYEWFPEGFDCGMVEPTVTGPTATSAAHTYVKPYLYKSRVEAWDNWNARTRKTVDVAVAPDPTQPLRVDCYTPQRYHFRDMEPVDSNGIRWLHDQLYTPGTWGYVQRSAPAVKNANYNPFSARASTSRVTGSRYGVIMQNYVMAVDTLNPWIHYKIPLPNGRYTLILGFADMRYAPAKPLAKAAMDIEVEGALWRTAFCPYDSVGAKTACLLRKFVDVSDNELEFKVMTNATSTDTAFLNCFEVHPGEATLVQNTALAPVAPFLVGPNPFKPSTRITGTLAAAGRLEVRVLDLEGRLIKTLFAGDRTAGGWTLAWNGTDGANRPAASGLYVLAVRAGFERRTLGLILMK